MRREISPNYAAPSTFYTQEPVKFFDSGGP